jgi:hypothetical protein
MRETDKKVIDYDKLRKEQLKNFDYKENVEKVSKDRYLDSSWSP